MISCRELTTAIASDEFANAGWRRRLGMRLHLLLCKHCRCYRRQVEALGGAVRKISGQAPEPSTGLEDAIVQRCLGECGGSRAAASEEPPES